MLVNGVPVAFEQTEDALSVYLNTELLLPLLKTLVVPLLSDEEAVSYTHLDVYKRQIVTVNSSPSV